MHLLAGSLTNELLYYRCVKIASLPISESIDVEHDTQIQVSIIDDKYGGWTQRHWLDGWLCSYSCLGADCCCWWCCLCHLQSGAMSTLARSSAMVTPYPPFCRTSRSVAPEYQRGDIPSGVISPVRSSRLSLLQEVELQREVEAAFAEQERRKVDSSADAADANEEDLGQLEEPIMQAIDPDAEFAPPPTSMKEEGGATTHTRKGHCKHPAPKCLQGACKHVSTPNRSRTSQSRVRPRHRARTDVCVGWLSFPLVRCAARLALWILLLPRTHPPLRRRLAPGSRM